MAALPGEPSASSASQYTCFSRQRWMFSNLQRQTLQNTRIHNPPLRLRPAHTPAQGREGPPAENAEMFARLPDSIA